MIAVQHCHLTRSVTVLLTLCGASQAIARDPPKVEIVPQLPHAFYVESVAFSPDGSRVLSGGHDSTVKLWDVATGGLVRTFEGHPAFNPVAFSPNGLEVLAAGLDGKPRLWDAASGRLLRTFEGHSDSVTSITCSPDGSRVLSGGFDNSVKLWDMATGALLHTFDGHTDMVFSVAYSPLGNRVLSGSRDKTLKLWDVTTGALLRTFEGHDDEVLSVAFSPTGNRVLSGSKDKTLKLWDVATGALLRTFEGHEFETRSVAFSRDGGYVLSAGWGDAIKLWNARNGALVRAFGRTIRIKGFQTVAFSPDGKHFLAAGEAGMILRNITTGAIVRTFRVMSSGIRAVAFSSGGTHVLSTNSDGNLRVWDASGGTLLRRFAPETYVSSVAFSPDGTHVLSSRSSSTMTLWNVSKREAVRNFEAPDHIDKIVFSPDGSLAISIFGSWQERKLALWNIATGALIRTFQGHSAGIEAVTFSADGTHVLSGSIDKTMTLWNVATGQVEHAFDHSSAVNIVAFSPDGTRVLSGGVFTNVLKLWDSVSGVLVRTIEGASGNSVAFSPDGSRLLAGSGRELKLWDVSTGQLLRTFEGDSASVDSVAFSPNGNRIVSGSYDNTVRIWDAATGAQLVTLIAGGDTEWLSITPAGFFASSQAVNDLIAIVRGFDVTIIDQIRQSLFNPDLVREALANDPHGELREATKVINLPQVLDSGPTPLVAINSPPAGVVSVADVATITARITDRGKGVGRIEWRVNGITAAVSANQPGGREDYTVTQKLALDPGDNIVEVVAYNASNLLASLPARTTIKFTARADRMKAKLHVLAIGINAYVDRGWVAPGSPPLSFAPLGLAVKDATAFADAMKKAAAGLYGEVRITLALDKDATRDKLERMVAKIATEVHPRDSFILFGAGHGTSENGRFYFIPQDYQSGAGRLARQAIGQDHLQDWLANRIKARRAIILLDTCESGALVAGYARSRVDTPNSEAAIGRLHEATGRPVLTAAAGGQFAHEGLIGETGERHGVFTWALLDALRNGDSNGNGLIELSELVRHVQTVVPNIAAGLVRAATPVPVLGMQTARFGSRGEDFAVVRRLR